jgi:uncharacterized protein (DUF58 family)
LSDRPLRLFPRRDPRLIAYAVIAASGLGLGLVTGRPGPVIAAAPFVVALLLGLRNVRPMAVGVGVTTARETVLEGDECDLVVRIERPASLRLLVQFEARTGVDEVEPGSLTWDVPPGAAVVERSFRVRPSDWGQYRLGTIWIEGALAAGLVRWPGVADVAPVTRVLPRPMRLQQLLDPAAALVSAGVHRSKLVGEGTDFAEVRPFVVGDRVRHLNWRATARFGAPHVNRHHPERAGEVVVFVDTFGDQFGELSTVGREAITRCARAAWAVTRVHLAAQDRVGFLTHGRVSTWLPPDSGDRGRYRLLDRVLNLGTAVNESQYVARNARLVIPPDALVVAFTPLWDRRIAPELRRFLLKSGKVVVVVVDTTDLFPTSTQREQLTARLWSLILEDRRRQIRQMGLTEVLWRSGVDLGPTIARLRATSRQRVGVAGTGIRR